MKQLIQAIEAELIKVKRAKILWATFIAFGIAPVMGAVFIFVMQNGDMSAKASALIVKAEAMNLQANWESYIGILTQAVGIGGVLLFGFVIGWIFGREYSDKTAKDLLALPTSRTTILNAKFMVCFFWCLLLVLSNLLLAFVFGMLLQLPPASTNTLAQLLIDYFITTFLAVLVSVPIAFFALWGKGYLAPLGFVMLTLVFSQIIAATGYGAYFPWAVPGLYSGVAIQYKLSLNCLSYAILLLTNITGYIATIIYWNRTDQTQ